MNDMTTIVFYVFKHMFSIAFRNASQEDQCSSIYRVADLAIRRREHIWSMVSLLPKGSPLACKLMGLLLKGVAEEIRLFVFKVDPMIVRKELILLRVNEITHGILQPTTLYSVQICDMMLKGNSSKCESTIALLAMYQLACGEIGEAWDIALKGKSHEVQTVLQNIDLNVVNILLNFKGKRKLEDETPKVVKAQKICS